MRCPTCETEGKRSTVRVSGSSNIEGVEPTSFHDPEGRFHSHVHERDGWIEHACSRGHVWRQASRPRGCDIPECEFNVKVAAEALRSSSGF